MSPPFFLAEQGPAMMGGFLLPVIIVVIFYFLVILPTRKRQKKIDAMIGNLKAGDKVITTGGVFGTIDRVKETTLMLKVAEQTKIEISKNAVAALQSQEESK
ncbi:MAG: preprotein translocase subunit YajC [Acidobacteria bacterium]|nr:preprotein translocase subunit YajC [Acidobacteriota bacterium]MBI3657517.1 preprotein translocase subunit YajC [Acidobacteriota bacterium]